MWNPIIILILGILFVFLTATTLLHISSAVQQLIIFALGLQSGIINYTFSSFTQFKGNGFKTIGLFSGCVILGQSIGPILYYYLLSEKFALNDNKMMFQIFFFGILQAAFFIVLIFWFDELKPRPRMPSNVSELSNLSNKFISTHANQSKLKTLENIKIDQKKKSYSLLQQSKVKEIDDLLLDDYDGQFEDLTDRQSFNDKQKISFMSDKLAYTNRMQENLKHQGSIFSEIFNVYKQITMAEYGLIFKTRQLSLYTLIFFSMAYLGIDLNNYQIFLKSNIDPNTPDICGKDSDIGILRLLCPQSPTWILIGVLTAFFLLMIIPSCLRRLKEVRFMKIMSYILLSALIFLLVNFMLFEPESTIYIQLAFIAVRCICTSSVTAALILVINQKVVLSMRCRVYSVILACSGLLYVSGPLALGLFIENFPGINEDTADASLILAALIINIIEIFCVYQIQI